ncbi:spore cortex biosynthesis protein YabQ [Alkalihalobacterium bogoriense]|uniref:spore cortex biosynthesis protein YabQ n=1 Tax=Alkalihalobacterium bogoriense TaxID=246272 RepID=UPI0004794224|nr:spore cortex biosynthesis protein YabQ [Alkalihalobacterium bogoriense]
MTLTVQLNTMLSMVAMGIWIGMAIDTYSRFMKQKQSFSWVTALNDFLFWTIQGLIVFYVLLQINHGEVRFYIFIALLCGYAAYRGLLEKHYRSLLEKIIHMTIMIYRFFRSLLFTLIVNPLKWLLKVLFTLCMMVITSLLTIMLFFGRVLLKPLQWIGLLMYKGFRIHHVVAKARQSALYKKVVSIIAHMRKGKNKED